MSLLRRALALSVPPSELAGFALSGSVFDVKELARAPLSAAMRRALQVVQQSRPARGAPLLVIARPEIFTHGVTLAWLRKQLGSIKDHLIFSDGSTVRPVSGMRNHLFMYRMGEQACDQAFRRFSAAAPELLAGLQSQVNTDFQFEGADGLVRPPTVLLEASRQRPRPRVRVRTGRRVAG